jgi:trigger factor
MIEIPADVVEREAETVTKEYARVARIPGFRPGRAPTSLVRRRYRDEIKSEIVQSLVPKFFRDKVKDEKWSVVGQPSFEDLKFEEAQPLTVKATFEVYPEFELGQYKGLEIEQEPPTVTEASVDEALEALRQHLATFEVAADRGAQDDDYVTVSYQGRDLSDPAKPPIEVREGVVHLSAKGTLAAFTENLRSSKPGEAREFDVAYPDDYPRASLKGKTLHYHVEVQAIKHRVLPALDDDLAKSASEYSTSTLAELRAKIREDLEKRRQQQVEEAARRKLLQKVVEAQPFPVPQRLVDAQLERKLESAVGQLMAQGIDPRQAEFDWRKFREEMRPEAEQAVRSSLILEKIAEAEKIEVTEEEVDEAIRDIAAETHEPAAALKTRLTRDEGLDRLKFTRRTQKALDFVYRNAVIIQQSDSVRSVPSGLGSGSEEDRSSH